MFVSHGDLHLHCFYHLESRAVLEFEMRNQRTPEPGSVTDVQRGIADLVIADMAHRKIIGGQKK